ncbi:MAG: FHA domain-containing protein [Oscillospiraceae bacterium]|nr:FHA domain-containing protein [Oscillospiraceae bacterium]MCL1952420.1 FHA domain-containing protein [Oscillospiraceae bacterium]
MKEAILAINRYALPLLGLGLVVICALRLLRRRKVQQAPQAFLLNTVNHDRLPLARYENSLGRSKHCDIVLNYPAVSRFHAVIARRRAGWVIIDTGSRGGTRLDGQPVEKRAALRHGQALSFGSFDFVFCDEEEEARLEREAAGLDR